MSETMTFLIIDDHPLIAQATEDLVVEVEGAEVIGIAATGDQGLEMLGQALPDIIILDFQLPDWSGDELAAVIKSKYPTTQIIIFTGIDITELYNHFFELGVSGILSKESTAEVVKLMITAVMHGHTLLPQTMLRKIRLTQEDVELAQLTDDEIHIMTLVTQGSTNEQIARDIHMSKRSVDNYLKKIYDKLGVRSRAQAVERFLLLRQKAKVK